MVLQTLSHAQAYLWRLFDRLTYFPLLRAAQSAGEDHSFDYIRSQIVSEWQFVINTVCHHFAFALHNAQQLNL